VALRCTVLHEAVALTAALREVPDTQGDLEWLVGQQGCDVGLMRRLAQGPASRELEQLPQGPSRFEALLHDGE
jgi:hypothetical protein